ncbi:hypothetical protein BDZ89DRAFT_1130813 [Hymenopellis radicata]|nr:hypothetical protein BDZ89DRAFT_1130813 [Hymenopellis radicata]
MSLSLFVVLTLSAAARAANDWSQPCFNGVCEYSLPSDNGPSSGSMKIWGSTDAISDITPAAGWDIIDCTPDAVSQDIRLVCTGASADCDHLYQNIGAVNKIVRLPESCGVNAFARVAKAWTPTDQSVPARLARRADPQPVRALTLDTDFASADTSKTGTVNFILQGANVPGADADLSSVSTTADVKRMGRVTQRGFGNFLKNAIDTISNALQNKIEDSNSFDIPFDVDQTFNLVNESVDCPPITAKLNIDVQAKAHAVASIGVAASGTIIPPNIDTFGIIATLNAELAGGIDLKADVAGTLDTGKIRLYEVGIPGLSFPGILEIGPTFQINAQALAKLDVNLDLNVGIVYTISNASFVFPPGIDDSKDGGNFNIGDTPLQLSVSPSVEATGTLEAHLIPSINIGISVLGDIVDASVFLELDAKAALTLELEASANGTVVVDNGVSSGNATESVRANSSDVSVTARSDGNATVSSAVGAYEGARASSEASVSSRATVSSQYSTGAQESATVDAPSAEERRGASYGNYFMARGDAELTEESAASSYDDSSYKRSSGPALVHAARGAERPALLSTIDTRNVTTDGDASFGGCFTVSAGFNVNIGAEGTFFGIFDASVSKTLFGQDFQIYQKCFGDKARRSLAPWERTNLTGRGVLDLLCPALGLADPELVLDESVSASSIE